MRNPRVDLRNRWVLLFHGGLDCYVAFPINHVGKISHGKPNLYAMQGVHDWKSACKQMKQCKTGEDHPLTITHFREVVCKDEYPSQTERVESIWALATQS